MTNEELIKKCQGCYVLKLFKEYDREENLNLYCQIYKKLEKDEQCPCWECIVKPMCSDGASCNKYTKIYMKGNRHNNES